MKKILLVIMSFIFFETLCFSQTPPNDKNWEIVKAYDFTTMNTSTFNNDWLSDLCNKTRQQQYLVEPQYYLPGNISLTNSPDGLRITIEHQSVQGKAVCYEPDTFKLSDGNNNYRTWNYTSGEFDSKDQYTYGYFEILCNLQLVIFREHEKIFSGHSHGCIFTRLFKPRRE